MIYIYLSSNFSFQLYMERKKFTISDNQEYPISTIQHAQSQCDSLCCKFNRTKINQLDRAYTSQTFNRWILCWKYVVDIKQRTYINLYIKRPNFIEHDTLYSTEICLYRGKCFFIVTSWFSIYIFRLVFYTSSAMFCIMFNFYPVSKKLSC